MTRTSHTQVIHNPGGQYQLGSFSSRHHLADLSEGEERWGIHPADISPAHLTEELFYNANAISYSGKHDSLNHTLTSLTLHGALA